MTDKTQKKVYLLGIGELCFDSLDEAYDQAVADELVEKGQSRPIYVGDRRAITHGDLFCVDALFDAVCDSAYDLVQFHADDYCDDIMKMPSDKRQELETLIVDWMDKNVEQPRFFQVVNIKQVEYSPDRGEVE